MKKTVIRLEPLSAEADFGDYNDFIMDSYPTGVWFYDLESDFDKNEVIFYSVDSQEESVKDFIEQTCEGCNFKIVFYEHTTISDEEWAECVERLGIEEDEPDFEKVVEDVQTLAKTEKHKKIAEEVFGQPDDMKTRMLLAMAQDYIDGQPRQKLIDEVVADLGDAGREMAEVACNMVDAPKGHWVEAVKLMKQYLK